jgi:hypothetical protein
MTASIPLSLRAPLVTLGQPPTRQWCGLVERVDLLLDQGEIMQRIEHEVLAFVRPARDLSLMHIAANDHLTIAKARRHRVIVEPARKAPQIVFKPDLARHAKAAPFKRNDQLLEACPSESWSSPAPA